MPKLKERLTEKDKLRKTFLRIVGGRLAADKDTTADLAKTMEVSDATAYRRLENPETTKLDELRKLAKKYQFTAEECFELLRV